MTAETRRNKYSLSTLTNLQNDLENSFNIFQKIAEVVESGAKIPSDVMQSTSKYFLRCLSSSDTVTKCLNSAYLAVNSFVLQAEIYTEEFQSANKVLPLEEVYTRLNQASDLIMSDDTNENEGTLFFKKKVHKEVQTDPMDDFHVSREQQYHEHKPPRHNSAKKNKGHTENDDNDPTNGLVITGHHGIVHSNRPGSPEILTSVRRSSVDKKPHSTVGANSALRRVADSLDPEKVKAKALQNLDKHALEEVEEKLKKAREIEVKAIRLEIKCEQLEARESEVLARDDFLKQEIESYENRNKTLDLEVEKRLKAAMAEYKSKLRQTMMKNSASLYASAAEGAGKEGAFLNKMADLERKAEEKKIMMELRKEEMRERRQVLLYCAFNTVRMFVILSANFIFVSVLLDSDRRRKKTRGGERKAES